METRYVALRDIKTARYGKCEAIARAASMWRRWPNQIRPYDASAREYARTSDRIAQLLIPGYVTVPVKSFPDLVSRFQQVSDAARAKLSLIGAVRQRGSVSLAPAFEAPKEPRKVYTVSRSIWEAVQTIPGASYLSRLAQLWSQERMYRARLVLLQRLKAEIDSARVVDPTVSA